MEIRRRYRMLWTCESHGHSLGSHLQHWPEVNATGIESALLGGSLSSGAPAYLPAMWLLFFH